MRMQDVEFAQARLLRLGLIAPAIVFCFAAGFTGPRASAAAAESLVLNGGFEQGDALPSWWNRHPREDVDGNRHLRDTTVFRSGKASVLLSSVAPTPKGQAGMQWNRYGIAVEGGAVLDVSFYVKTEGVGPAGAGCHFYGNDNEHLGFTPIRTSEPADDWIQVCREVLVPAGAKKMGFALYGHDPGKTWYDDVAIVPNLEAQARRAELTAHFAVPNGGDGGFRVVIADALEKIPRREAVVRGRIVEEVVLSAARDETEAFQLVVIPNGRALDDVEVEATPLGGPGGRLEVAWNRVGYVKTARPSYAVEYVGWWP
ncbi:MAG: hypothetical protein HQ582_17735, partial [Planctomycetes bacterium]|nr:hypothetical protein [Planctomycetota bacterium]